MVDQFDDLIRQGARDKAPEQKGPPSRTRAAQIWLRRRDRTPDPAINSRLLYR